MRHVWSLIAGVVIAPLAWALLALGQAGAGATVTAWAAANAYDTADLVKPAAYLVAAGVLLGLIATLRVSPAGALVAATAYVGLNVGLFIDPFAVRDAVPNNWKPFGETIPLRTPMLNGTLLAVGVLLLMAAFSAKRWRRWPAAVVPGTDTQPGTTEQWPYGPVATTDSDQPTYSYTVPSQGGPAHPVSPAGPQPVSPASSTPARSSAGEPPSWPPQPAESESKAYDGGSETATGRATPSPAPTSPGPPPAPSPPASSGPPPAPTSAGPPPAPAGPSPAAQTPKHAVSDESPTSPWSAPPRQPE